MSRLHVKYNEEIAPALMSKFQYKSVMQIPKLSKVIVNVGCGESKGNAKEIEAICKDLATITGQKPITTKADVYKRQEEDHRKRRLQCGSAGL